MQSTRGGLCAHVARELSSNALPDGFTAGFTAGFTGVHRCVRRGAHRRQAERRSSARACLWRPGADRGSDAAQRAAIGLGGTARYCKWSGAVVTQRPAWARRGRTV